MENLKPERLESREPNDLLKVPPKVRDNGDHGPVGGLNGTDGDAWYSMDCKIKCSKKWT